MRGAALGSCRFSVRAIIGIATSVFCRRILVASFAVAPSRTLLLSGSYSTFASKNLVSAMTRSRTSVTAKVPKSYEVSPPSTKKGAVKTPPTDDRSEDSSTAKTKSSSKRIAKDTKSSTSSPATLKKAKKSPAHQVLTERDELPRLWNPQDAAARGSYAFKIASWNVAGLRALLKKDRAVLSKLASEHNLDVLCLQETKLQEMHLDDFKLKIRGYLLEKDGYDAYYACSTTKKGYSGTAVFVKRRTKKGAEKQQAQLTSFFNATGASKANATIGTSSAAGSIPIDTRYLVPEAVSFKMGISKHDGEGRIVCCDFPLFTMVNVYVPNSGQELARLDYRIDEWDKDFLTFIQRKRQERHVPVLWLGDLNVAHTNLEVWNDGAKHLSKQAGVTPQERASFQAQLDAGFVDAFRHLHPNAKGHYSYWSMRAGNRSVNKGLRLDYFVCDPALLSEASSPVAVKDCYMLAEQTGSDHCPVVLELELRDP